jgi:ABC-2 type transport system permease protein
MGFIAKEAGRALVGSATLQHAVARLGDAGGSAASYLGIAFLMVALLIGFVAAGQMAAARAEEAGGRLDHLLVRPVSRSSWLLGRVAVVVATLSVCGLVAGLAAWTGAASQHAGLGVGTLIAAGLNVVPPAICVLAAGVLAMGAFPRGVAAVTYGLLAWSFLVEFVGGLFGSNHWLLDLSLFHQMASAPAVRPDWRSAGALLGIAAAAISLGTLLFSRRDLAPD